MPDTLRSEILPAWRSLFPVLLAVMPFGMVYGTVAAGAGLSTGEAMGLTSIVYAGASQLAAIQLLGAGAPLWSILLTVVALNFRHVLYSASIGRHLTQFSPAQKALAFFVLTDPAFGAAEARSERQVLTKSYYFAYAFALYAGWVSSCYVGTRFGALIEEPKTYGLDFILPVYFLALLMTFRTRNRFYPVALTSAGVSLLTYATIGSPWHVTLGGLAGVGVAAVLPPARQAARPAEAAPAIDERS